MQDITEKICTNTAEGFEKQLKDTRDGQLYWVGKMKDGRCWMLQNLALGNSSSATTLTSADSDVSSDWSLPASRTAPSGSTSTGAVQSWNFGKWVLATPLSATACSSTDNSTLASCTKVGFVDVSETSSFRPTYTAATGTWNGATVVSNTLVAVNCTTWSGSGTSKKCIAGTYDAHYLVGNYYSWNAATVSNSGSICPKGWELPYIYTSGSLIQFGVKDFGDLLAAYGVESSLSGTPIDGTTTYNIAGDPLKFVRGGAVNVANRYISVAGRDGLYWSSTPDSGTSSAYVMRFSASNVNSASTHDRYNGDSVRCVAEYTYDSGNNQLH